MSTCPSPNKEGEISTLQSWEHEEQGKRDTYINSMASWEFRVLPEAKYNAQTR